MKKLICMMLCVAMAVSMLTGCGSSSDTASGENGELNLYIWTEYVAEDVIQKFEDETGIKVNVSYYSSNEDLLAKLKAEDEGAFDVIQPSDYMVEDMIKQELIQELDLSKLPNFKNIGEQYKNPAYDPENKYSVPYLGGVVGIAVNTANIKDDITSYANLFEEKYKQDIVVLDDFRAIIGMTERSMGLSMNETDQAKLGEVQEKLLTLKDNIKLYDSDSPKSALISGECNLGVCWAAEIAMAMDENPDIKIVFPSEGAYVFIDNWSIPKGAKNLDNAYKWIDFIMDADNMAQSLQVYPYMCCNTAAIEKMDESYTGNEAKNVPASAIENGEFCTNLDTDTMKIYNDMWTQLKK